MKRTGIKRKPAKRKPRPRGVYCQERTRCPRKRMEGEKWCPKHTADHLCRALVMERDKTCRRCGSRDSLQWAHLLSRRYGHVRADPRNSMVLCAPCHLWQTHNPIEGEEFFIYQIGQAAWDENRARALHTGKIDHEAIIASLRKETE